MSCLLAPIIGGLATNLQAKLEKHAKDRPVFFLRFAVPITGRGCQGWTPRPAEGVFSPGETTLQPCPAVPHKNGQNCKAVAVSGQNKGQLSSLESFQLRKPIMEQ